MDDPSERSRRFLLHLGPLTASLQGYARRMLRDPGHLEDVLQSALANAFRDFDLFAEGTNFRAWIFRYVTNEIRNQNRARKPRESLGEDVVEEVAASPAEAELAFDALREEPDRILDMLSDSLANAVASLPTRERECLLLKALGDFSYREIAETLAIPAGSVMGYLSRARARIRMGLGEIDRRRRSISPSRSEEKT